MPDKKGTKYFLQIEGYAVNERGKRTFRMEDWIAHLPYPCDMHVVMLEVDKRAIKLNLEDGYSLVHLHRIG